tara:strand:- start:5827 stop:7044 length:1218 start_codon:yes stop_codon:yes gene_type:complete
MGGFNPVSIVSDVFDSASDIAGDIVDFGGDVIGSVGDVAGDLASNADIDTAFYLATGNYPAAAGSLVDDELGFNPATFYDPSTGGFTLNPTQGATSQGIFGTGTGQIDLGTYGNILGNVGVNVAANEFMDPGEGNQDTNNNGIPDIYEGGGTSPDADPFPQETQGIDYENILKTGLDYFFGEDPQGTPTDTGTGQFDANALLNELFGLNLPSAGIGALLYAILTGSDAGKTIATASTDTLKSIGSFLKDYPSVPAGILAGLTYADRQRLNEQIEEGFAQYKGGKQAFAEKIASGQTRALPTRPLAKKGGIMSTRPGYMMGSPRNMMGSEVPVRQNPQGVSEMDFRETGGFVPPIGIKEKADDIPAMLSNNEFVFTADAVRAAGGGSVNKGAEKMYALMKQLEGQA